MPNQKQKFGQWGEEMAAQYLISKDYEIVGRNIRNEFGELDLIVKKDDQLVFVEVKARRSENFGFPEEAVTESKRKHILEAAQSFMSDNLQLVVDWRIDVISIQALQGKSPEIIHFENAFG